MKSYVPIEMTKDGENALAVSTDYQKGGVNILGGDDEQRGIYISVYPVILQDGFERCIIGRGCKFLLAATQRNSKDLVAKLADAVKGNIETRRSVGWECVEKAAAKMGLTVKPPRNAFDDAVALISSIEMA